MNSKSKTDDDRITIETEYDEDDEEKMSFAEYIRKKREEYNEYHGTNIKTRDLGNMLGIDNEMFRKILNQWKPTKKRDCIIAIGVALGLYPGQVDMALDKYNFMPELNDKNPRDSFIIKLLSDESGMSVQEFDKQLQDAGFPGLDIQNTRNGRKKIAESHIRNLSYEVIKYRVRTPIDTQYCYGDPYDSLSTIYAPSRCKGEGDMIIQDKKNQEYICLTEDTEGFMSATNLTRKEIFGKRFENLDKAGDYKPYFIRLDNSIEAEKRRLLNILNDTRNYQKRISARLLNDSICVFTEQFYYGIPELSEYYFLCSKAGQYQLLVYNQSAFMSWYLPEKNYKKYYGKKKPIPVQSYSSIEDLEKIMENTEKESMEYYLCKIRKKKFMQLKTEVDDLKEQLRNREVFINNLQAIYDIPGEVLRYYNIEKDFECKYDEYSDIIDWKDENAYSLSNGVQVLITFGDICRAFELGFSNIDEICRVKAKYGSIDAVLR